MVGYEADIRRELLALNRHLSEITRVLQHLVREQRLSNTMFRKAYNLSSKDVAEEDDEFRKSWA